MCPAPSQVAVPPVRVLKCGLLARFLETFHSWEQQGPQVRKPLPGLAGFQEAQVSLTPPVKSWAWASPLYLEHLEQVCSQPSGPDVHTGRAQRKLWIWPLKCILQFKNHIASSPPSPRGGEGRDQGQSSPWLQREPDTISGVPGKFARFRILCQHQEDPADLFL